MKGLRKILIMLVATLIAFTLLSGCEMTAAPSAAAGSGLYINEVVSSNVLSLADEKLGTPDWIELYNPTGQAISLSGYFLTDNVKNIRKYTFPDVSIDAKGYLVIYACKDGGDLCTGFGLSKAGDRLFLSDKNYNMLQDLTIPQLSADVSYARSDDGRYGYCAEPTPGEANTKPIVYSLEDLVVSSPVSDALKISELVLNNASYPDSDGRYPAWAELYNSSSDAIALNDYFLTDDPLQLNKWNLPNTILGGGERIIVFFNDKDDISALGLNASFKLGKADTALTLSDTFGNICSNFTWDTEPYEDIAILDGSLFTAFPTPLLDNSTRTFTNAAIVSSTDATIVLNEVLLDNKYSVRDKNGDRSPWVELFNASGTSASLSGYYLSDDETNPFKWALPDIEMAAGEYKIVFLSGRDSSDGELHASFRLSRGDGLITLTNKDGLSQARIDIPAEIGDNVSIGIYDGALRYFTSPTPGAANTSHAFSDINELCFPDTRGVYITEVSAVGNYGTNTADYIELYNGSDSGCSLKGWYISDDNNDLTKFELPDIELSAHAYIVINASKYPATVKGVCAPFSISQSGETLFLSNSENMLIDVYETGALRPGLTSGRLTGDASARRYFFTSASKGSGNTDAVAYTEFASEPMFSQTGLYQSEAFSLSLSCGVSGATIFYTLDGSAPTHESMIYSAPLQISANTVIRAFASASGMLDSDIVTYTYLFEQPHTLPVVCLSIDKLYFDEIYAVLEKKNNVEREAHITYYESDGRLGCAFPCGLRASGASTLLAAQKSFGVSIRGRYGQSAVSYPFFKDSDVSAYSSLVLRNSGQDRDDLRMRDSFFQRCVKGLNIENVETRPVVMYVNGSYWGIYDLNENQNEDYMAAHYGIDPNAVDIIRRNVSKLEGSAADIKRVRDIGLNSDLSSDSAFAEYLQWVDSDYFMDFLIAQTYFSNWDMFNQKYWRSEDYTVKWRPVFFDLDLGLSSFSAHSNNLPSYFKPEGVPSKDGSITNMDLFVGFRKNAAWCDKFCERYVYVVENLFTPERLIEILDEMADVLRPEMARHRSRWSHDTASESAWERDLEKMRQCLTDRPSYALEALQKEFGFSDEKMQEYKQKAAAN